MNVLAIFAHPRRDSFTGSVLDAFVAGVDRGGNTTEVADLYREGFETRFQLEDYAQFSKAALPDDVRREQARVERADGLAFVFPIWWWSFPAALKGWIDRVFSDGWAYSFALGLSRGLLRDRPTLLLGVGGSRELTFLKYGYSEAMRVQIDVGILGYCGLRDVETHFLYDVEESAGARSRYLAHAHELGRGILSDGRPRRMPALGSERPA